ncbi:MAG: OmpA family protein [Flavobacteriia bacterium]|nr:OmpA family protein [Flavobacteriia bacterium]
MNRLILYIILFTCCNLIYSQDYNGVSDAISDCDGAMNIIEPGTFSIQLTGKAGRDNDLKNYPALSNLTETNSIWCTFIAPFHGFLNIDASLLEGNLQMAIFDQASEDPCQEIKTGIAEILRLITNSKSQTIGLSKNINENYLYSLEMREGQKIKLLINTSEKIIGKLKLVLKFESIASDGNSSDSKIVDKRDDDFSPYLSVIVRDASNGKPVIANFTIEGIKDIAALYSGSDFYFTLTKSGKIKIKCDAQGYFFADRAETITLNENKEMTIWLEPLGQGKSIQIEEIEFYPGTSDFMPSSEAKLRRLKDFMALNAEVKIEIQGHVFAIGDNSFAAQKLSEARAKRVLIYLAENGINKERMTSIGYGNTKPIYPKPQFAYEEQANRRVEVKVIQ